MYNYLNSNYMKSILFTILGFFLFISCEKENIMLDTNMDAPQTKSTEIPEPIDQLAGIPVNIRLVGQVDKNYNYLSSNAKSDVVDRHSSDDGSLRQQWYISKNSSLFGYNIKVVGGAKVIGYITLGGGPNEYYPFLHKNAYNIYNFDNVPNTSYYNIAYKGYSFPYISLLLCAEGTNRDLLFKHTEKTDNRAIWEIIPVEDFELTDIRYLPIPGKIFTPTLDYKKPRTITNDGDTKITHEIIISETIMESSTFSKVEGVTMTNKITTKANVGLPVINGGGEISHEHTTAKNWSYQESKTEQRERVIQDKFSIEIPPHTKYIIDVTAVTYNIDVTYIATLVGKKSGKTIQLKGTWRGVECNGIDYNAHTADGKAVTVTGLRNLRTTLP